MCEIFSSLSVSTRNIQFYTRFKFIYEHIFMYDTIKGVQKITLESSFLILNQVFGFRKILSTSKQGWHPLAMNTSIQRTSCQYWGKIIFGYPNVYIFVSVWCVQSNWIKISLQSELRLVAKNKLLWPIRPKPKLWGLSLEIHHVILFKYFLQTIRKEISQLYVSLECFFLFIRVNKQFILMSLVPNGT